MALAKWLKRREGLRNFFNESSEKIKEYLQEESISQARLVAHKKTLSITLEQLASADNEVLKLLEPDDVAGDIIESMQFLTPANELEAMIDLKLVQLTTVKDLPPSSITSSNSTNVCKLPKMELPIFKGDPLEWQGFWDQFQVSHT